jgi:LDH2 family malate/lactate/ureidoglycolate dehydrogenase
VQGILEATGIPDAHASRATDVFVRASWRGVGHHDLEDLPMRLRWLAGGVAEPAGDPVVVASASASERIDGGRALGEVVCSVALERAMHLAEQHGVGFVAAGNSNHFLAAAPYVQIAAERGLIAVVMSRTVPSMGLPGSGRMIVGNNPLGFGAPVDGGPDVMLDISMAYASWGELDRLAREGGSVPAHWATAADGTPTTDPAAARAGGPEPIGGHKGVGLSLLVEVLSSVLGGGDVADEGLRDGRLAGIHSQAVLVIDPGPLVGRDAAARRTADAIGGIAALAGGDFRYPGERAASAAAEAGAAGGLRLRDGLVEQLDGWADRLRVAHLDAC